MNVDLHVHSYYSDGTDSPARIVEKAKNLGIELLALTDHDTIKGWPEFIDAAREQRMSYIPGIEFEFEKMEGIDNIHVLGYFFNDSKHLRDELGLYSQQKVGYRNTRTLQIIGKLHQLGYCIDIEEIRAKAGGDIIGKPHIGAVLIDRFPEQFKDMSDVDKKLLGNDGPAHVSIPGKMPLDEGITYIHSLGGLAILAHPGVSNGDEHDLNKGDRLVQLALGYGVDGIEGDYLYHKNSPYKGYPLSFSTELSRRYIDMVLPYGKIITTGSDYHGMNKKIELGEQKGRLYNFPFHLV